MKSVPCVGCGAVYDGHGRPMWTAKEPLCPDCRHKLENYDSLVKATKKLSFVPANTPGDADIWNWRPNLYYPIMSSDDRERLEKRMAASMLALWSCFPPMETDAAHDLDGFYDINRARMSTNKEHGCGFKTIPRLYPAGFPQAFREFLEVMSEFTRLCAQDGKRRGADLLDRLMTGDLSCEEVNERSAENKG